MITFHSRGLFSVERLKKVLLKAEERVSCDLWVVNTLYGIGGFREGAELVGHLANDRDILDAYPGGVMDVTAPERRSYRVALTCDKRLLVTTEEALRGFEVEALVVMGNDANEELLTRATTCLFHVVKYSGKLALEEVYHVSD